MISECLNGGCRQLSSETSTSSFVKHCVCARCQSFPELWRVGVYSPQSTCVAGPAAVTCDDSAGSF
jgi:hypothetical protein